jgi:hypothetical protein
LLASYQSSSKHKAARLRALVKFSKATTSNLAAIRSAVFGLQSIGLARKLWAVQLLAASMSNIAYKRTAESECGFVVALMAAAALLGRCAA